MITLAGGAFQDAAGNLINGTLTLVLSADSQETITAPNGQVVSGIPINIVVSNGNVVSTNVWSNAELVIATYYTATLVNTLGEATFKRPQIWVFSQSNGASVNLGTVVSSAPPSTAYPAVTSFNNRTGAVVSAPNDYSFSQLSGSITQAQLPGGTTGSGAVVLATSPTLVTPILGAASATSLSTSLVSTSSAQLQLQQTGDAGGTINAYLRNRTGQNGLVVEDPRICLSDLVLMTSAVITNIAIDGSNNLTVTAAFAPGSSSLPAVGQKVTLSGLTTATFLEGQVITIATISASQFTGTFVHATYASHADTGKAVAQLNVRAEFRNDKVVSALNTDGEIQFVDPTATVPWFASGTAITNLTSGLNINGSGNTFGSSLLTLFNGSSGTSAGSEIVFIGDGSTARAAIKAKTGSGAGDVGGLTFFAGGQGSNALDGQMTLNANGSLTLTSTVSSTGYQISGAGTSGHVLRGNGTSFVNAQLAFSDLSGTATAAQYVTMLGDSGSGGTQGAVPAPSSGDAAAGKFLKADATWAVPSGGGSTSKLLNFQPPLAPITPASNIETTLYTYTIPANTFTSGTGIRITVLFQHTTGTTSTNYKCDFGVAGTFNLQSGATGTGLSQWQLVIMQDSVTANTQYITRLQSINVAGVIAAPAVFTATETTANALIVKITATVTSTTDSYTPQLFLVELVS